MGNDCKTRHERVWVVYAATGRAAYLPRLRAEQLIAQGRAVPFAGGTVPVSRCRLIGGDGGQDMG